MPLLAYNARKTKVLRILLHKIVANIAKNPPTKFYVEKVIFCVI